MVGVDSTFLSLMLHPKARPPQDPTTKKPVDRVEDRIEKLLEDLDAEGERIILPTPALCEFLLLAGREAPEYLDRISAMKTILVRPFDEKAAIELVAREAEDRAGGSKRGGGSDTWNKVRFDRQVVAIVKANGGSRIYADDESLKKYAVRCGLTTVSTWELPLPAAKQTNMEFESEPVTDPLDVPPRSIRLEDKD